MNILLERAAIAAAAHRFAELCGDDERLFADTMEGETRLHDVLSQIYDGLAMDKELLVGINARQDELSARKSRVSGRIEARRNAIAEILRAAQQSKIELPEATFSVRDGALSLKIIDDEAVPDDLCRFTRAPDKAAINAQFSDTELVKLPNWIVRERGKPTLTIRTK